MLNNGSRCLEAVLDFPGLPVLYSVDGGDTWRTYTQPVIVPHHTDVHLKTRSEFMFQPHFDLILFIY